MKCLNHLLHFIDTYFPMIWICTVRTFRHIIILRIIAPVELRCVGFCFVYRSIIKARQNLYVSHSKIQNMIKSCSQPFPVLCSALCQSKKLTCIPNPGRSIGRQITNMYFINHCICSIIKCRSDICIKSIRIGSLQIKDLTSVAIYACTSCI